MQNSILFKEMFKEMFKEIQRAHYILIVTHKNPDADTLSSALALSNFFYETKIKHKVFNYDKNLPRKLNFLSKFEKITNDIPKYYDLIIYVDCANQFRVGCEFENETKTVSIDHHQSNSNFANINIVDYNKGSTAELLYGFFKENNLKISKNVSECLYVGIYDDSLAFTAPRTNKDTFHVITELLESKIDISQISNNLSQRESLSKFKAISKIMNTLDLHNEGRLATVHLESDWIKETGVLVNECDEIVDTVLNIGIVQVVAYFRVVDNKIRVSLRSKGDIDVSIIAANFNGGGHKNAAGLTIVASSISEAKIIVSGSILNYI